MSFELTKENRAEVLDLNSVDVTDLKITTKYCCSDGVHDLHVKKSMALGLPPVPIKLDHLEDGPIALVCSGPSLLGTIEDIRPFKTIMTCSGAHDVLLKHGIKPTHHAETDPREHKARMVTNPQDGIKYLIASNCHPAMFDQLKGREVYIWHVVGKKDLSTYRRGDWAVTGGSNVGMRAMVLCRTLGYRDVHIFGMDCSADSSKQFHAHAHLNEPKEKSRRTVKIGDREFVTSDVFLEYARQFFSETLMLNDTRFTLHGDGLLQAMADKKASDPAEVAKRNEWVQKNAGKVATVAYGLPHTITEEYAEQNRLLHEQRHDYGVGGGRHAPQVLKLIEKCGCKSVLDYGAGKCGLQDALDFPIWSYDPAVPEISKPPRPAELVCCFDVLEHIEPDMLDNVLMDLRRVTKKLLYATIHTGPSSKNLPDGRNAHLLQHGAEWWRQKLSEQFFLPEKGITEKPPMLHVVAAPKKA